MSDRPTPLTDAAEYHSGPDTSTAVEGMVDADFARDLERQLAEAKEAIQAADTLLAKLGYQPTDLTRAKLAQHLTP